MVHSYAQRLHHAIFHPLFLLLVAPLAFLLPGTLYALYFVELHFFQLLFLYLFALTNEFLEKLCKKNYRQRLKIPMSPFLVFNFVNGLLILYFVLYSHILIALLLLCYSVVMQAKFCLYRLPLSVLPIFLSGLFRGGVLLYVSFYVQLNFIPTNLFYWSIPIIIGSAISEFGNHWVSQKIHSLSKKSEDSYNNDTIHKKSLFFLYFFSFLSMYTLSLFFWWNTFQHLIWILLLTLPLALHLIEHVRSNHTHIHWKTHENKLTWFSILQVFVLTFLILFHFHF